MTFGKLTRRMSRVNYACINVYFFSICHSQVVSYSCCVLTNAALKMSVYRLVCVSISVVLLCVHIGYGFPVLPGIHGISANKYEQSLGVVTTEKPSLVAAIIVTPCLDGYRKIGNRCMQKIRISQTLT